MISLTLAGLWNRTTKNYPITVTFMDVVVTLDPNEYGFLTVNQQLVGIDISPYSPISDYADRGKLTIYCSSNFSIANPLAQVRYMQYLYGTRKLPFPPAINFLDTDPINQGPIGTWIGWGSGSTIVPSNEDNTPDNLIFITMPNASTYVYNKYSYYQWIDIKQTDPMTRAVISPEVKLAISKSLTHPTKLPHFILG